MVHSARLLLAAIYTNHAFGVFTNVFVYNSEDILDQAIALTKATIIACVGSVATGVFKTNIDQKEELEALVQERTKVIHSKTKELRRITVAFKASETAIAITDSSRFVIWTNHAFEELAKRTKNMDLPLDKCTSTSSTGDSDDRTNYREKSDYRVEVTPFVDSDDVDENFSEMPSDNERKLFLVAFHDITADYARKEAERVAREEALVSKAMKESMVTLTHELRTPLQGIMGITSLLLQQDSSLGLKQSNKDALESLGLIMASSSLLLNLINNLLDVKKVTANMMEDFLLTPLLAADIIQEAIDFCKPLASISRVSITTEWNDDAAGAFVNANALRLQQVVINIISNAIKYTDQGTTIRIYLNSVAMEDAMEAMKKAISCSKLKNDISLETTPVLVFSFSDVGPGIDLEEASRLFHRFTRLGQRPTNTLGSSNVGQPSGTGLGLHLCQMFVQLMNGYIWVANNESGKGSTFSFCLPLVAGHNDPFTVSNHDAKRTDASRTVSIGPNSDLPKARLSSIDEGDSSAYNVDFARLRVLVVDDTLINRKVFDRMLKRIGVVNVCTVESGEDALIELFLGNYDHQYDVVITDLQMPGMSGTELTQKIMQRQASSSRKSVVVVGLTADTSPNVAKRCAASGMSDVLYKPITVMEIKDYFQNVIGRLQPGVWQHVKAQF
eukprot:jgi/Psemu1/189374/e_gw1.87.68.1